MIHSYKLSFSLIASVLWVITFCSVGAFAQSRSARSATVKPTIEYNFPMDGSKYVPSNTPIIIRPSTPINVSAVSNGMIVTGTLTGVHTGNIALSDDKTTMIFTAADPFESGERVTVTLGTGITSPNGGELAPVSFSFDVQDNEQPDKSPFLNNFAGSAAPAGPAFHPLVPPTHILTVPLVTDTVGPDTLSVTINNNPAPGYLFLATFNYQAFFGDTGGIGSYRMVLNQNGDTEYVRHAVDREDWDFQPQPNGLMTYFELPRNMWYAMDSNYKIVDSFSTTSPYIADLHDFELLAHGHALMLSYYPIKPYDLSKYGGKDTATFIGGVIEEIDSLKRPVWIWRSWDPGHYNDTDATHDFPISENPFDAVHPNAVSVDTDGNILLSARELDEVSKISRKDGSFIWRLGGKHNQFQHTPTQKFINDSIGFSHQHGARRIANGNITLFDNGNFDHFTTLFDTTITLADTSIDTTVIGLRDTIYDTLTTPYSVEIDTSHPTFSRACEYSVNTDNMTATLVWHYDHDSTIASTAMGFVQRLPNNNTLISWGLDVNAAEALPEPTATEVTIDKTKTFELNIKAPYQVYRVFKYPSPNYDTGFVAPAAPDSVLGGVSETSTPNAPSLGSPFPNPSSGNSDVTITATPSDRLELDLYDPLGRKVQTYFSGIATAPTFTFPLATGDMPNGAYELVLRGSGGTASRQLVILR